MKSLFLSFVLLLVQALSIPMLASVDVTTYKLADENAPWHPTKIQQDDRGMIWVGSWNGLFRYDGYHFQSFKPEPGQGIDIDNDRIRDILLVGGDSLLCRVEERVYVFDVMTCEFHTLSDEQQESMRQRMLKEERMIAPSLISVDGSLSYVDINQEYIDKQGNRWLKSNDHIYCIHPTQQHGRMVYGAASQDVTRCLYRDSEGYYWLCSRDKQQVVLYDSAWQCVGYLGQDGQLHQAPTSFASIYCVFDDGQGTLWLGAKPDGMYRLRRQGSRFDVKRLPLGATGEGLPTTSVYDIQVDSLGTLWLASWDDGIICIDNPHESRVADLHCVKVADRCSAYPSDALKARRIAIRPDGTLLATTTRGLLVIDDIYKSLSQMTMRLHRREPNRKESLTSSATMSIAFDAKDRLYVATESGGVSVTETDIHAERFDFEHYTAKEGLTSEVSFVFATLPDDRMLVVCPNGISVIDADHAAIESYGPQFWNTNVPFTECTPYVEHDSLLVLANEEGIVHLPLGDLTQQGFRPYIAITSLTIGNEPTRYDVDRMDTLRLTSSQRSMMISFSALDLRSNHSLRYRTRLGDDWSRAVDSRDVMLQDLNPGTYRLQICSSNAEGQWTDNIRTITIIVEPRFVESWYGRLLITLLFAALIAGVTWMILRMRRIDSQRHELLQTYLALLEQTTKAKISAAAEVTAQSAREAHHASREAESDAEPAEELSKQPVANVEGQSHMASNTPQHLSVSEQQFMERLVAYVESNISNCNASLSDMADATATSKSSLTRKTHQLLGVTPADFLKEARMKRASQLLLTTSQSLTEIALACGFSDPKYFSKCFKASTGKTPTEYRS